MTLLTCSCAMCPRSERFLPLPPGVRLHNPPARRWTLASARRRLRRTALSTTPKQRQGESLDGPQVSARHTDPDAIGRVDTPYESDWPATTQPIRFVLPLSPPPLRTVPSPSLMIHASTDAQKGGAG